MAELLLLEPHKALRNNLLLNLVSTGGFTVIAQQHKGPDQKTRELDAILVNRSVLAEQHHQATTNCPVIVYKTPSSNLNDPCSFISEAGNRFRLTFSMTSLPAVASAIWQIIHTR